MYIFQSLEFVLYAAIIPVAMALAASYIIYGRDKRPTRLRKAKLPKDLQDSFYAPWPTLNDLIRDGSVTVTHKEKNNP